MLYFVVALIFGEDRENEDRENQDHGSAIIAAFDGTGKLYSLMALAMCARMDGKIRCCICLAFALILIPHLLMLRPSLGICNKNFT